MLGLFVGQTLKRDVVIERRWIKDYDHFPLISDGGCGIVNVTFNLKSSKSETWCNGVA